jgi:hypothetical protein
MTTKRVAEIPAFFYRTTGGTEPVLDWLRNLPSADSDEVAHLYRDDAARDSDLISPGCEPSSGSGFLALVLGRVNPPFDSKSAAVDVAVGMWTTPLRVVQA